MIMLSKQILMDLKIDKWDLDRFIDLFGNKKVILTEELIKQNYKLFYFNCLAEPTLDKISYTKFLCYKNLLDFDYFLYKEEQLINHKNYQRDWDNDPYNRGELLSFKNCWNNINLLWIENQKELSLKYYELLKGD